MAVIKPKRGLKANLPAEAENGELIVTSDTREVYMGRGTGKALDPVVERERIDAYDPSAFTPDAPFSGDVLLACAPARTILIKASAPGRIRALTPPTGAMTLLINLTDAAGTTTQVGSASFVAGAASATFSISADITVAADAILTIEADSNPDPDIRGIIATLKGHMV